MADFTMCVSERCPHRNGCRRHEAGGAKPSARQSWADFQDEAYGQFWCRANEAAREAQGEGA